MYLRKGLFILVLFVNAFVVFIFASAITGASSHDAGLIAFFTSWVLVAVSVLFDESAKWKRKEAELDRERRFGRLLAHLGSHEHVLSFLSADLVQDFARQDALQQIGERSPDQEAKLRRITTQISNAKDWHRTCVSIAEGHGYELPKGWTYTSLILPEHMPAAANEALTPAVEQVS